MKKFLISVCTLLVTLSLILLGIVQNMEVVVIDTVDTLVQKELKDTMVDYLKENTDMKETEIEQGINRVLEENEILKKTMTKYMDKALEILTTNTEEEININQEVEQIINDSNPLLKEYGITITEEDKKEILANIAKEDVNKSINDTIKELKNSVSPEIKSAINTYSFLRSQTFQYILIGTILILLLLIALLKKSYYKWLSNFGSSCLISGVIIGIVLPASMNIISKSIPSEKMLAITTNAFNVYGYIMITLGIIAIIVNIFLSKMEKQKAND